MRYEEELSLEHQIINYISSRLDHVAFAKGGRRSERENQTPVHTVNIKDADGYVITEQRALKRELKKIKLFREDLVYSAFVPSLLSRVLKTGSYRSQNDEDPNFIFCCEIMSPPHVEETGIYDMPYYDIFDYFQDDDNPIPEESATYGMIAIYSRNKLRAPGVGPELSGSPAYRFENSREKLEALVAVVRVVDQ